MTTQLELTYVLRKHKSTDRFDSELPMRIDIPGGIELLVPTEMDDAASRAVMGLWQVDTTSLMTFVRHSQVAGLRFPDPATIRKLRFRIQTSAGIGGQEREISVLYEIMKNRCEVVPPAGGVPGQNWVSLVTFDAGVFRLFHRKPALGPGPGDPCAELNCLNTTDWVVKIKCILNGCAV